MSSLRLRINELSEDLKLHHHFTMLSIDAARLRLNQIVRTTVIQYIFMVIITIAAVRACRTISIFCGEKSENNKIVVFNITLQSCQYVCIGTNKCFMLLS